MKELILYFESALNAHAQCCPLRFSRGKEKTKCLFYDNVEKECDMGCEYCKKFKAIFNKLLNAV